MLVSSKLWPVRITSEHIHLNIVLKNIIHLLFIIIYVVCYVKGDYSNSLKKLF